jgi:transcriptional regulator with XRE-family HTH domain
MDMKIDTHKMVNLRNAKAWSQQHLADVSGLSLRTIQRIEKTQSASQESVRALAAAFDTSPEDLFFTGEVLSTEQNSVERIAVGSPIIDGEVSQVEQITKKTNLMWLGIAIIISVFIAIYWSQSVRAINEGANVIQAGSPINVSKAALGDATNWLTLIDGGEYADSWQTSSAIFRTNISQEKWVEALQLVRKPLGSVNSRELALTQAPTSLPGLPDGEYLVLIFSTKFEERPMAATETLSLVKTSASYQAIGYFIR